MGIGDRSRRGCDNPRNIPLPFRHTSSQKRIRMFEFCHLLWPRRAADEQEGQAVDRRVRRRDRQLRQGKGDKGHAVDISRGSHKKPHHNAMFELHMTWESTNKYACDIEIAHSSIGGQRLTCFRCNEGRAAPSIELASFLPRRRRSNLISCV